MNQLMILNTSIRQDEQGRYSLNDLHKASGGNQKHRPKYWLANQQTQELIDELTTEGVIPPSVLKQPVSVIKGGNAQGTYVCKELVYSYAMWISPKFHLKVIRTFDALMTEQNSFHQLHPFVAIQSRVVVTHYADGRCEAVPLLAGEEVFCLAKLAQWIDRVDLYTCNEINRFALTDIITSAARRLAEVDGKFL